MSSQRVLKLCENKFYFLSSAYNFLQRIQKSNRDSLE